MVVGHRARGIQGRGVLPDAGVLRPAGDAAGAPSPVRRPTCSTIATLGPLRSSAGWRLASLAQANQEVVAIARGLQQQFPESNERRGMLLRAGTGCAIRRIRAAGGARRDPDRPGVCRPAGGLRQRRRALASRAPVRAREMALRLAIGGSRARLMRQMITETALIAAAGGVAGFALGYAGIMSFRQFQVVTDVGVRMSYELDGRALVVGLVIAAVSALLSSVIPAWRTARAADLSNTLRTRRPGQPDGAAVGTAWAGGVADRAHARPADRRAVVLPRLRDGVRPRARFQDGSPAAHDTRPGAGAARPAPDGCVLRASQGARGRGPGRHRRRRDVFRAA